MKTTTATSLAAAFVASITACSSNPPLEPMTSFTEIGCTTAEINEASAREEVACSLGIPTKGNADQGDHKTIDKITIRNNAITGGAIVDTYTIITSYEGQQFDNTHECFNKLAKYGDNTINEISKLAKISSPSEYNFKNACEAIKAQDALFNACLDNIGVESHNEVEIGYKDSYGATEFSSVDIDTVEGAKNRSNGVIQYLCENRDPKNWPNVQVGKQIPVEHSRGYQMGSIDYTP